MYSLGLNSRPPRSGLDRRGGYESCAPRNSSGRANQLSYLAIYNLYTLWSWTSPGWQAPVLWEEDLTVRRGGYESCAPRNSSGQANQLSYLAKFLFPFLGMFGIIGYLPKHLFSFLFTQFRTKSESKAPKTECKYEGLLAEMQIERNFRSELIRNFTTRICLQTNLLLIIN